MAWVRRSGVLGKLYYYHFNWIPRERPVNWLVEESLVVKYSSFSYNVAVRLSGFCIPEPSVQWKEITLYLLDSNTACSNLREDWYSFKNHNYLVVAHNVLFYGSICASSWKRCNCTLHREDSSFRIHLFFRPTQQDRAVSFLSINRKLVW